MVVEHLDEPLLVGHRLHLELGAVDVGQLGSESVATARDYASHSHYAVTLLRGVVEVRAGKQLTEDERGNVHFVFRVNGYRDAVAVVIHGDGVRRTIHRHLDCRHLRAALLVVDRVHQDLVEDLDQPRVLAITRNSQFYIVHFSILHSLRRFVVHPHGLGACCDRTD